LPDLATPRLDKDRIAERAKGRMACLGTGRVPEAHELPGLLFDVLAHPFAQFAVKMPSTENSL
jgi:hypothetical protein